MRIQVPYHMVFHLQSIINIHNNCNFHFYISKLRLYQLYCGISCCMRKFWQIVIKIKHQKSYFHKKVSTNLESLNLVKGITKIFNIMMQQKQEKKSLQFLQTYQEFTTKEDLELVPSDFHPIYQQKMKFIQPQDMQTVLDSLKKFNIRYKKSQIISEKISIFQVELDESKVIRRFSVTLGSFQTQFDILFMTDIESICHKCESRRGNFHNVYFFSYENQGFAAKCHKFKQNTNYKLIVDFIKEYFYLKIASALRIAPQMMNSFGFDLIVYRDCLEFYQEKCDMSKTMTRHDLQNLLSGLRTLHQLNIVHFDIKIDNVAYSNRLGSFVFLDFGLSNQINIPLGYKYKTKFIGTPSYCYEQMVNLLHGQNSYNFVDVYYNDLFSLITTYENNYDHDHSENNWYLQRSNNENKLENSHHQFSNPIDHKILAGAMNLTKKLHLLEDLNSSNLQLQQSIKSIFFSIIFQQNLFLKKSLLLSQSFIKLLNTNLINQEQIVKILRNRYPNYFLRQFYEKYSQNYRIESDNHHKSLKKYLANDFGPFFRSREQNNSALIVETIFDKLRKTSLSYKQSNHSSGEILQSEFVKNFLFDHLKVEVYPEKYCRFFLLSITLTKNIYKFPIQQKIRIMSFFIEVKGLKDSYLRYLSKEEASQEQIKSNIHRHQKIMLKVCIGFLRSQYFEIFYRYKKEEYADLIANYRLCHNQINLDDDLLQIQKIMASKLAIEQKQSFLFVFMEGYFWFLNRYDSPQINQLILNEAIIKITLLLQNYFTERQQELKLKKFSNYLFLVLNIIFYQQFCLLTNRLDYFSENIKAVEEERLQILIFVLFFKYKKYENSRRMSQFHEKYRIKNTLRQKISVDFIIYSLIYEIEKLDERQKYLIQLFDEIIDNPLITNYYFYIYRLTKIKKTFDLQETEIINFIDNLQNHHSHHLINLSLNLAQTYYLMTSVKKYNRRINSMHKIQSFFCQYLQKSIKKLSHQIPQNINDAVAFVYLFCLYSSANIQDHKILAKKSQEFVINLLQKYENMIYFPKIQNIYFLLMSSELLNSFKFNESIDYSLKIFRSVDHIIFEDINSYEIKAFGNYLLSLYHLKQFELIAQIIDRILKNVEQINTGSVIMFMLRDSFLEILIQPLIKIKNHSLILQIFDLINRNQDEFADAYFLDIIFKNVSAITIVINREEADYFKCSLMAKIKANKSKNNFFYTIMIFWLVRNLKEHSKQSSAITNFKQYHLTIAKMVHNLPIYGREHFLKYYYMYWIQNQMPSRKIHFLEKKIIKMLELYLKGVCQMFRKNMRKQFIQRYNSGSLRYCAQKNNMKIRQILQRISNKRNYARRFYNKVIERN